MCGISIVINTKGNSIDDKLIRLVNDRVSHRGPDDEGFYFENNFAFGHRRLSIIDLSKAGHQPMIRGSFCITYNGEIYNYIELRQQLKVLGYEFVSESDTEVILAAYQQWGIESFKKFNGMWAFAIYDATKNEILFCRDHFGIKPLYYTSTGSFFLAGSEIKQFTVVNEFTPLLNKAVAANFLVHGLLNYSEQTFFDGVNELRPGHFLRYNLTTHKHEITRWYNLADESVPTRPTYSEAVKNFSNLFRDSVRIRMRSDVRVGSCLSGGLDSSSIVSVVHSEELANKDFATITSCYNDKRYDEQIFSDAVSRQTGFRTVKVFPDLNNLFDAGDLDKMIYHQDQPFSGASHYSEFKVFQSARTEKIIVMQDGQGSDEFLCGYGEFYLAYVKELLLAFKWIKIASLIKEKSFYRGTSQLQEIRLLLRSAIEPLLLPIIKRVLNKREYPWLSAKWSTIVNSALVNFNGGNIRELSLKEIQHSSIPYQLHSEDRNSMLFSVESRLPFLDHRLVEYCISLPSEYKIRNSFTKAVLRDAIKELPESIKYRRDKMGFAAPDLRWMKENKERIRQDLESAVISTGIFSGELLNRFDRFVNGELEYEAIYFRAMTLNRFCKLFNIEID
jgi:asparagine synthase (glutamine-hydrolysing)